MNNYLIYFIQKWIKILKWLLKLIFNLFIINLNIILIKSQSTPLFIVLLWLLWFSVNTHLHFKQIL